MITETNRTSSTETKVFTTVVTNCIFTFPDGQTKEVAISHFQPSNEDEIQRGIQNRYESELAARDS